MPTKKKPIKKRRKKYTISPEERERRSKSMKAHRLMTITLQMRHNINGQPYGPGVVKVPIGVALTLLNQEGVSQRVEREFRGTKGVIVGRRGIGGQRTRQVPSEMFDEALNTASPIDTVQGGD